MWCFTPLFLLFSTSDWLSLPVFVIAAAKTLLNKKADVKVRVITCFLPTSLPSLSFQTYKLGLFVLFAVFLSSNICFFSNLTNLTFVYYSSFFFVAECVNFVSRVLCVIISLDVLFLVIYVVDVVLRSDAVCLLGLLENKN